MRRSSHWKSCLLIGAVLAGAGLFFDPAGLAPRTAFAATLDEIGGSQILLELDENDLVHREVLTLRNVVTRLLAVENIDPAGEMEVLPRGVRFQVPKAGERARILPKLRGFEKPQAREFGGQLRIAIAETPEGYIQLTYTDEDKAGHLSQALDWTMAVLRRRAGALGVADANVLRVGTRQIMVQLPGIRAPQGFLDTLTQTARLEFRFVATSGARDADMLPMMSGEGEKIAVERRVVVSGKDLVDAQAAFNSSTAEPEVLFEFGEHGTRKFARATQEGVGRNLAIVIDEKILTTPTIRGPITQGRGVISGQFTPEETKKLAVQLRSGALPAKLDVLKVQAGIEPAKTKAKE